jgi:lysophospholipase L1-like esterase
MGRARHRGQATSEYLGAVLVVGVIMAGLAVVTGGDDLLRGITDGIERALCMVSGGGDCGSSGPDDVVSSDDPAAPTPIEIAQAGDYVAIGDSFSSGEGAGDYDPLTDNDDNSCHRSEHAYPARVADEFDFQGDVRVVTCSGAVTDNVLDEGQHDEITPQVDAITPDTSLVTIGIGGNDTGWSEIVKACMGLTVGHIGEVPGLHLDGCGDTEGAQDIMDEAADQVLEVYKEARRSAPEDARVIAMSYPRFFPVEPDETWSYCLGVEAPLVGCVTPANLPGLPPGMPLEITIDTDAQRWMNEMTEEFSDKLATKAEEAGIEFVDMTDAFNGHELTTDDSYLHGLDLDLSWPPLNSNSFHPTVDGQGRFYDLIREQLEDPE